MSCSDLEAGRLEQPVLTCEDMDTHDTKALASKWVIPKHVFLKQSQSGHPDEAPGPGLVQQPGLYSHLVSEPREVRPLSLCLFKNKQMEKSYAHKPYITGSSSLTCALIWRSPRTLCDSQGRPKSSHFYGQKSKTG